MLSYEEIKNNIKNDFYSLSKINIKDNSIMDKFISGISKSIHYVYTIIEEMENPHIFTKLKGKYIDSMGLLVRCAREENEEDDSYLYRMMNWTSNNEASNIVAINNQLINLKYSNHATYVPLTNGVGTATIYVIPKTLSKQDQEKAFEEIRSKMQKVCCNSSIYNIIIPEILKVKIAINLASEYGDKGLIKHTLEDKIKQYINNIGPGEYLRINDIDKIGNNENNVDLFKILNLYINDKPCYDYKILQNISSKLIYDKIIWMEE